MSNRRRLSTINCWGRRPWTGLGMEPTRSFLKEGAIEAPERKRRLKTSLPVRRKTPNFSMRPNPGIATQGGSITGAHRWLH